MFGNNVRVQVVVPPAVERGVSLSIRKYVARVLDAKEIVFVQGEQIDVDAVRLWSHEAVRGHLTNSDLPALFRSAIDDKMNILISGGTSSGKATIARALLGMCHKQERLVTIEDAVELRPTHDNAVALVASRRDGSDRTIAKLLENLLRMRPDRLIVGDLLGSEAYTLIFLVPEFWSVDLWA